MENLEKLLESKLNQNTAYLEALKIVRENSQGKIWLIGSGVYKTLLNLLYNQSHPVKDWDFIVEKIKDPLKLESGWETEKNKHGNFKLKKDGLILDFISLDNIHNIKQRGLSPDINHYLTGTPLTIQSVVFDTEARKIIGEIGINSISKKVVDINNKDEYEYARSIYGDSYSLESFTQKLFLETELSTKHPTNLTI